MNVESDDARTVSPVELFGTKRRMFDEGHEPMPPAWRSASLRTSIIFCLWLIVAGLKPTDLIAGAIAAALLPG